MILRKYLHRLSAKFQNVKSLNGAKKTIKYNFLRVQPPDGSDNKKYFMYALTADNNMRAFIKKIVNIVLDKTHFCLK